MIDKKLSNKLPTLRNQMMKKLMSFQSVLHQGAFNKYMDIVINKNKSNVLKVNDVLDAMKNIDVKPTKKFTQPKKTKINLHEEMKTRQPQTNITQPKKQKKQKINLDEIMKTRQPIHKIKTSEYFIEVLFKKDNPVEGRALLNAFKRTLILKVTTQMLTDKSIINKLVLDGGHRFDMISRNNATTLFLKWMNNFLTDEEFLAFSFTKPLHYIRGFIIKIISNEPYDTSTIDDMMDSALFDVNKFSMFNPYMATSLDMNAKTFNAMMIQQGKKENCVIKAILQQYGEQFNLSLDRLLNMCNLDATKYYDEGVKINQVKPFFEKYRIPYRIYNAFNELINYYTPPTINTRCGYFYASIYSNHLYSLNKNTLSLAKKTMIETNDKNMNNLKVSSNFKYIDERKIEYIMIQNIDDIVNLCKVENENDAIQCILANDDLNKLYFDARECGYIPKLYCNGNNISGVSFNLNNVCINVSKQNILGEGLDGEVIVQTAEEFEQLLTCKNNFQNKIFKKNHCSYYTDLDKIMLNEYKTIPHYGRTSTDLIEIDNLIEIDIRKAYTGAFIQINKIVTFNEFDIWMPYNNERIEDYTLYHVSTSNNNMFFNKNLSLCYGFILVQLNFNYIIRAYKKPSIVVDVEYAKYVEELYKNKIHDDVKINEKHLKDICNVSIGLMGKNHNKSQVINVFDTVREANTYKKKYGGEIIPISWNGENEEIEHTCEYDDLDDNYIIKPINNNNNRVYGLVFKANQSLNNGFQYVHELVMQLNNFKIYNSYHLLKNMGVIVYSIKTDAFTIHKNDIDKITDVLGSKLGDWRIQNGKPKLPSTAYTVVQALEYKIEPIREQININIVDEYDTQTICKQIENKQVMITGGYPGVGKSYIAEYFRNLGKSVLFVVPTNTLADKYRLKKFKTITIFKFQRIDIEKFDVVVFDEILFCSISAFITVQKCISLYPDKTIIGTGDSLQLEAVERLTNTCDQSKYVEGIIKQLFQYNINLYENKRLKTQADKNKLKQLKNDIFNDDIKLTHTLFKYFKFTTKVSNNINISYTNRTARVVSSRIRKARGHVNEYDIGEKLLCKIHTTISKQTLNCNCKYKIMEVHPTHLVLKDICPMFNENSDVEEYELFSVPLNTCRTNFIYGHCSTCHSYQGSSIEAKYTIFDIYNPRITRRWAWTAITRATDLNNITIYDGSICKQLELDDVRTLFVGKIGKYKTQDSKAKRPITSPDYITPEFIFSFMHTHCDGNCDGTLLDETTITMDRIDDTQPHIISNCMARCNMCNCSHINKYMKNLLDNR